MPPRLPSDWEEVAADFKAATRTEDKRFLTAHRFLASRKGFALTQEDAVLQDLVYESSFNQFHRCVVRELVAAYSVKSQEVLRAAIGNPANARWVAADTVYFDASRVASKEILVVFVHSMGYFLAAPLQVLVDSPAKLHQDLGAPLEAPYMGPL